MGTVQTEAQDKIYVDSILKIIPTQEYDYQINSYRRLFIHHFQVDAEMAKPFLDSAMAIAERNNDKLRIASTLGDKAVFYQITSRSNEALPLYDRSIKLFQEIGDKEQESVTYNNKGNSLRQLGRYEEAMEANLKSIELKEQLQAEDTINSPDYWEESIAANYWNIGNILGDLEDLERSNDYYRKAENIYNKLGQIDDVESVRNNLAINLQLAGKLEEAKPLFKRAIAYNKSKNYYNDLAASYDNLGMIYFETDSLDLALENFEKAFAISKNYQETTLEALNLRHIGQVNLERKNFQKALPYFTNARDILIEADANKQLIEEYRLIAETNAALGNYKAAFENFQKHTQLYKDILGEENLEKIKNLEIRFQTERKQREIEKQQSEIKILEEKEAAAKIKQKGLMFGLILIVLLGAILLYAIRQKMKRNRAEREKLDNALQFKEKELTTHALHLAHKNEVLLDLKSQLKALKTDIKDTRTYQSIINNINLDINNDGNWEQFRQYFEDVHKDFNANVKHNYPEVTNNDLRLMSLLKMNLSSKEIANILNISPEGVKKARYRLRKKLNLNSEDSLQELVITL
ncbi:MAG: tetratricopeptide repeat protein [Bacteroidota bacterium]